MGWGGSEGMKRRGIGGGGGGIGEKECVACGGLAMQQRRRGVEVPVVMMSGGLKGCWPPTCVGDRN
jgi:hypothetical protein